MVRDESGLGALMMPFSLACFEMSVRIRKVRCGMWHGLIQGLGCYDLVVVELPVCWLN